MPAIALLRQAIPALLAGALVWQVMDWRHTAAISALARDHAEAMREAAEDARDALASAQADHEAKTKAQAAHDADAYRRLRDAENENARLRADVDGGRQRLRVAATCPGAPAGGVPDTGASTGMDHGAAAELDPAARPDYHALRAGISRVTHQLAACQARLPR